MAREKTAKKCTGCNMAALSSLLVVVVSALTEGVQATTNTSPTPSPTPMCTDTSNWVDVDNGITCGDCTVLASLGDYGSCNAYCDAQGLRCAGAWEEEDENCVIKATYTCADNIHVVASTSDGLCQCTATGMSGETPSPTVFGDPTPMCNAKSSLTALSCADESNYDISDAARSWCSGCIHGDPIKAAGNCDLFDGYHYADHNNGAEGKCCKSVGTGDFPTTTLAACSEDDDDACDKEGTAADVLEISHLCLSSDYWFGWHCVLRYEDIALEDMTCPEGYHVQTYDGNIQCIQGNEATGDCDGCCWEWVVRDGVAEAGTDCYGQTTCEISYEEEYCPNGIFRDCTGASGIDDGHCGSDTTGVYYANWTRPCPTAECCAQYNNDDDDDDDGSITSVLLDAVQGLYKVVKAFIYDTWNSYT